MLKDFVSKLNVKVNDFSLYEQAFVHRSYINENPKFVLGHNERLEFLGDAVLELSSTEFLFEKYKNIPEGELTEKRSNIVNTNTLAKVSERLGFNDYLKLSKGEARDTGKARISILADTFEAFLGAMYLDNGKGGAAFNICKKFLEDNLFVYEKEIEQDSRLRIAKSLIQEISQEKYSITPSYQVLHEEGKDHDKTFKIGIYFGQKLIAEGVGKSKQEAETEAAKNALLKNNWI